MSRITKCKKRTAQLNFEKSMKKIYAGIRRKPAPMPKVSFSLEQRYQ